MVNYLITLCIAGITFAHLHDGPPATHSFTKDEALKKLNAVRAKGCKCGSKWYPAAKAVKWNDQVADAAQFHADDMASKGYFEHRSPDGSSIGDRITRAGYRWRAVAENIGWGYESVDDVIAGWKDSPGHCATMMDPFYQHMGLAQNRSIWVLDMASPLK